MDSYGRRGFHGRLNDASPLCRCPQSATRSVRNRSRLGIPTGYPPLLDPVATAKQSVDVFRLASSSLGLASATDDRRVTASTGPMAGERSRHIKPYRGRRDPSAERTENLRVGGLDQQRATISDPQANRRTRSINRRMYLKKQRWR